jgi:hypothetical protein
MPNFRIISFFSRRKARAIAAVIYRCTKRAELVRGNLIILPGSLFLAFISSGGPGDENEDQGQDVREKSQYKGGSVSTGQIVDVSSHEGAEGGSDT